MSCGLGLPNDYQAISSKLPSQFVGAPRAHAAALASLVNVEGCFELIKPGAPAFSNWPKLSTLLSLEIHVGTKTKTLGADLAALEAAVAELLTARTAFAKQLEAAANADGANLAPPEGASPGTIFESALALKSGEVAGRLGPARSRLVRAAVAVADAAIALARGSLQLVSGVCGAVALPCNQAQLARATGALDEVRSWLAVATEASGDDLGRAAIALLGAVQASVHRLPLAPTRKALLKHVGLLVAIASAKDSDGVARALDQAATPVGGWRGKGVHGATTISVTAQPALFTALELRNGTYGADREEWNDHFQAPTLALPVGIEVAWGGCRDAECVSPVGLFFPLLDPAGFLAYDVEKDGRLPGASIKTALSPGFGLRLGVPDSPFSFIPLAVYRPGFRQWHSDLNGTGADALQIGLLLSVDVTLYELSRKESN